ncbi:uncharacterized protein LOC127814078 [Diospyros lotus]|uniref:uncharacterized protein LOC127814078 n=1 Tax=Diospyros lotus TaxID=55363 RepID=UPI002259ECE3|nr:uncharacterized protein LOC127814078 [Diospyros lotus]XP_052211276.1 uncharacterized protein LOC127814078 [Diospyros lotus]
MGFNSVYRVLQDVFPQVDTRMLRAVAIENPKDADAAVEVVLVEVIPYLSGGSAVSGSFDDTVEDASDPAPKVDISLTDQMVETPNGSSSCDANGDGDKVSKYTGKDELVSLGKQEEINVNIVHDVIYRDTLISEVHKDTADNGVDDQVHMKNEGGEFMSVMQDLSSVRVGLDQGSHVSSPVSKPGCTNEIMSSNLLVGQENFDGHSSCDCNIVNYGESLHAQPPLDDNQLDKEKSVVQVASLPVQECNPDIPEGCLQLAAEHAVNSDWEKLEPDGTTNVASKENMDTRDTVQFEDENPSNTIVTRSGQICRIDLLEDIIEDARSNKKTLFLAMESVISLMREVELQEKAAEQAREEAVRGGLDILTKVEDLKAMLQHAKEANDMHAGEVYGEKAILATEARELQSRLLSLSDERDKSLAILDEMRQTLEERMDAAEKDRRTAEQERMEKEESARKALAEQELIMEKVVQESKMLKEEAEENSKLQEFLIDRGRVVDVLQGEISVICQDVKLLKEKFDGRVPLSKSLSSSQTSCILASSSSSFKSTALDQVPDRTDLSDSSRTTTPGPSADDELFSGEERAGNNLGALVEDGWELFDNREDYA